MLCTRLFASSLFLVFRFFLLKHTFQQVSYHTVFTLHKLSSIEVTPLKQLIYSLCTIISIFYHLIVCEVRYLGR